MNIRSQTDSQPVAQRGFTLLEFIVTLSVASLLVVAATPAFQETTRENRMRGEISQLEGALNLARLEAMRRNNRVTVCAAADPNASQVCKTDGSGWSTGWIVFSDLDGDRTLDAGDELIRVYDRMESGLTLDKNGNADWVQFRASGASTGSASTFRLCDERGFDSSTLAILSNIGRISIVKGPADPRPTAQRPFTSCP